MRWTLYDNDGNGYIAGGLGWLLRIAGRLRCCTIGRDRNFQVLGCTMHGVEYGAKVTKA